MDVKPAGGYVVKRPDTRADEVGDAAHDPKREQESE
jgi:hypothetical protein